MDGRRGLDLRHKEQSVQRVQSQGFLAMVKLFLAWSA